MRIVETTAFLFALACLVALGVHCTPAQRQAVADVTQITADIACAIEQAELNDAEIAQVCRLTDDVLDRIKPALATHRKMLIRRGLNRGLTACKDGGT